MTRTCPPPRPGTPPTRAVATAGERAFTTDPGRTAITADPADFEAFDSPQLRGIAQTAPYFHYNSRETRAGLNCGAIIGRPGVPTETRTLASEVNIMFRSVEPAILYIGTPVVLVSSLNPDGSPNLAPMSSLWFLGWTAVLGFDAASQTPRNIQRTGECVLNLPDSSLVSHVDRLALLTGRERLPLHKRALGYRYEREKFAAAGLEALPSETVKPPRVRECPIQLEATLEHVRPIAEHDPRLAVPALAVELRVRRVHVDDSLLVPGEPQRIDPERWHPLLMSFRQFFGRGQRLHSSRLAEAPESRYAPPRQQIKAAARTFMDGAGR
jgi:flavin reductase (DIM6/NTAB) family NADH-FMN oxidoreductase RutF